MAKRRKKRQYTRQNEEVYTARELNPDTKRGIVIVAILRTPTNYWIKFPI